MKTNYLLGFAVLMLGLGCTREVVPDLDETTEENRYLLDILSNWYLWRDEVNLDVDPAEYASQADLLAAVKFSDLDRWSKVTELGTHNSYYYDGQIIGYGFRWKWSDDGRLFVSSVFDEGPMGRAGITRGWKFISIDGVAVSDIGDLTQALGPDIVGIRTSFLMEDQEGMQHEFEFVKELVPMNTVLHHEVFEQDHGKVGYLVFSNFVIPSIAELDAAFADFAAAGANELILDLRYNPGGFLSVAEHLVNYLIPSSADGQVFVQRVHVSDQEDRNEIRMFAKHGTLDLSRITILASSATASASELVINGLRPYMDVVLIGPEASHGKPVGANVWERPPNVFTLITNYVLNADGEGYYFEGIEPDLTVADGLPYDWGDPRESMLAAALRYYETGELSGRGIAQPHAMGKSQEVPYRNAWQAEVGIW